MKTPVLFIESAFVNTGGHQGGQWRRKETRREAGPADRTWAGSGSWRRDGDLRAAKPRWSGGGRVDAHLDPGDPGSPPPLVYAGTRHICRPSLAAGGSCSSGYTSGFKAATSESKVLQPAPTEGGRAVRQADSQTLGQWVSQLDSQLVRQSVSQSVGQSVRQAVGQTVSEQSVRRQADRQSVSETDGQTVSRSVRQSVGSFGRSVRQTVGECVTFRWGFHR